MGGRCCSGFELYMIPIPPSFIARRDLFGSERVFFFFFFSKTESDTRARATIACTIDRKNIICTNKLHQFITLNIPRRKSIYIQKANKANPAVIAMLEVRRLVALLGTTDGRELGTIDEDGFCEMTVVPFAEGYGASGVTVGRVPTGQTVCRC